MIMNKTTYFHNRVLLRALSFLISWLAIGVCAEEFNFDQKLPAEYESQKISNYHPGGNICYLRFRGLEKDTGRYNIICKPISKFDTHDADMLYWNSQFAQLRGNKDLEFFFLSMASKMGHSIANFNLGMAFFNGDMFGLDRDMQKGFKLLKMSAESGYTKSMHNIAEMLFYGDGTDANMEEAFYWCKKVAHLAEDDEKFVRSQYMLASLYEHGHGVEQSYESAFYWFMKAAEKNHPESLYKVSHLITLMPDELGYELSHGMMFLFLSREAGYTKANLAISALRNNGLLDQESEKMLHEYSSTCNPLHQCVIDIQEHAKEKIHANTSKWEEGHDS